ncbi:hypothetical protein Tco_0298135, partial [Tanacetum coccineum]
MQKNKKVDVVSASEGDAPPAEGQDDCGESKKGVSDELSAPAVSEEDAPAGSEDVFDVDLSKRKEVEKTMDEESVKLSEDGGLFDNADRDLTDSEEEDNVEWGPENLRSSVYKEREDALLREFEARRKEWSLSSKIVRIEEKSKADMSDVLPSAVSEGVSDESSAR